MFLFPSFIFQCGNGLILVCLICLILAFNVEIVCLIFLKRRLYFMSKIFIQRKVKGDYFFHGRKHFPHFLHAEFLHFHLTTPHLWIHTSTQTHCNSINYSEIYYCFWFYCVFFKSFIVNLCKHEWGLVFSWQCARRCLCSLKQFLNNHTLNTWYSVQC